MTRLVKNSSKKRNSTDLNVEESLSKKRKYQRNEFVDGEAGFNGKDSDDEELDDNENTGSTDLTTNNGEDPSDSEISDDEISDNENSDNEYESNQEEENEENYETEESEKQLYKDLDAMIEKWTCPEDPNKIREWAIKSLGITQDVITLQLAQIPNFYEKQSIEITKLFGRFLDAGLVSIRSDSKDRQSGISGNQEELFRKQAELSKKFGRMNEICRFAMYNVESELIVRCLSENINYGPTPSQFSLFRYSSDQYNDSDVASHQKFLLYLLRYAQDNGYRRYGDQVYKQVIVEGTGKMTHAWEPFCTIEQFVHDCVDKDVLVEQWKNSTKDKGCSKFCTNYLKNRRSDREFPFLNPNRHAFSFKNGIYFTDHTEKQIVNNVEKDVSVGKFFRYEEIPAEHEDVVTCKFFKQDFPEEVYERWQDIPTPKFKSILELQGLDENVIEWIFALIGRLFYLLGEKDKWQILLFIKGIAGSGKSTIASFIKSLFNPNDIGMLTCGNHEKTFGVSAFYDKLIYMCTEVKADFGLPQDVLQSMITGETISVAIKSKTAIQTEFKIPGIFFGNEFGDWVDNAGSVSRRFLVCEFLKPVKNGKSNPNLIQEIQDEETGLLIQKMNRAYLDFASKYNCKDIWDVVPEYFKETKKRMRCRVNSLMSYMMESKEIQIVQDEIQTIPLTFFSTIYREYCKKSGMRPLKLDAKENCESVFDELGAELIYDEGRTFMGREYSGTFVRNAKVNEHVLARYMGDGG